MPTFHRELGFRFMIYTNDHLPMHVHASHGDELALFNLGDIEWRKDEKGNDVLVVLELPSLRDAKTMKRANRRRALAIVVKEQQKLIEGWHEIHG